MASNDFSFLGVVSSIVERWRGKRERKKFLRSVDDANYSRRNVMEYNTSPIEAYISNIPLQNIVISGNNSELRERVACAAAYNAQRNNRPVVILHDGNRDLMYRMENVLGSNPNFYSISDSNRIYNPFAGRSGREISNFIISSGTNGNSPLNRYGVSFIDAITLFLETRGFPLTLSAYIDCIKNREYDDVTELVEMGIFPEDTARLVVNRIRDSRESAGDVDAYFSMLDMEMSSILAPVLEDNAISIKNVISSSGVVMIDVSSNSSNMLNIIVQEIKELISRGQSLTLILESVSIDENEGLARELRNMSSRCNFVYSADDVYARAQANESIMSTMVGRSNVFVLQHSSGFSTEQFSRYFGEYDKDEISENHYAGSNQGQFGVGLPGYSHGGGLGTQRVRRRKVDDSDIVDLRRNQAYVKLISGRDVICATFCDGSCTVDYAVPTRSARSRRENSAPISWLLFAFLIIWVPPIGLIYLMVKSRSSRTRFVCGAIFGALLLTAIVLSVVFG